MKKHDLFQLVIMGIGAWAAYQCFVRILAFASYLIRVVMNDFRFDNLEQYLIYNGLMAVCYFLVAHFALQRTEQLIGFLKPDAGKNISELGEEEEPAGEAPSFAKRDILRLILIGIGLVLMIPQIPPFLQSIYHSFQSKLNPDRYPFDEATLIDSLISLLVPAILIIFSRGIASLFKFK